MSEFGTQTGGRPELAVDLEKGARAALARAHGEAEALAAETRRELERETRERLEDAFRRGREEGWSAGHREGRDAGFAQALNEARPVLSRAAATLANAAKLVARSREAVRAEAEAGIVRLASAIGEKLAARELDVNPDAARADIREAIGLASERAEIRVLVNPAEREAVEAARESLREEYPEIITLAIEPDAAVTPGGARVVTASATVEATLEARAGRIAELLVGEPGEPGESGELEKERTV